MTVNNILRAYLVTIQKTLAETWRGGGGNAVVNFRFAVIELGTKRNLRF